MRDLPTIHPRKGTGSKYSTRIKQALLGGHRFDTDTLVETFPEYLDHDMDIEIVNRENVLSSSYQVENTYFVKVVTSRHLKAHGFLTWWRNMVFKMSRLPAPFASFDTVEEMVAYEYEAATATHDAGGAIAKPYAYSTLEGNSDTAAILYDYVPNVGKVEEEEKSLKAFEHTVLTMRRMHNAGYTHTSLPYHVVQSVPTGEPYVTDPIGRTHDSDRAMLIGIGFDISTLLARYTPYVGTLPALNTLGEHYSDVELVAAFKTATPIQVTVPGTPPWVISHLKSSINEYADADAVDTYLRIVGEEYDTAPSSPVVEEEDQQSPYSTSEFIQAVMDSGPDEDPASQRRTYGDPLSDKGDDEIRLGEVNTDPTMTDPEADSVVDSHGDPMVETNSLKSPRDPGPTDYTEGLTWEAEGTSTLPGEVTESATEDEPVDSDSPAPDDTGSSGVVAWLKSLFTFSNASSDIEPEQDTSDEPRRLPEE